VATQKQIEANRRNAQLSAGPKTEEGKRISSMNRLTTGLDAESQFVLGESREEFALLQTEWYDYHPPANPEERFQLDKLIRCEWLQRRFFRIDAQVTEYQSMLVERATGYELGEAFSKASLIFGRLQRRVDAVEKARTAARAELDRLIAARPAPQPQQTKTETSQLGSFRGFEESDTDADIERKIEEFLHAQYLASRAQDPAQDREEDENLD
jgi:hypothetical protein